MLIWQAPLREKATKKEEERDLRLQVVQIKRSLSLTRISVSFCKKFGHQKKDCPRYYIWCLKKGIPLTLVCFEVNLVSVSRNTWWLDFCATTHISVSMQDYLNY